MELKDLPKTSQKIVAYCSYKTELMAEQFVMNPQIMKYRDPSRELLRQSSSISTITATIH
jgi:hypothetical protein